MLEACGKYHLVQIEELYNMIEVCHPCPPVGSSSSLLRFEPKLVKSDFFICRPIHFKLTYQIELVSRIKRIVLILTRVVSKLSYDFLKYTLEVKQRQDGSVVGWVAGSL